MTPLPLIISSAFSLTLPLLRVTTLSPAITFSVSRNSLPRRRQSSFLLHRRRFVPNNSHHNTQGSFFGILSLLWSHLFVQQMLALSFLEGQIIYEATSVTKTRQRRFSSGKKQLMHFSLSTNMDFTLGRARRPPLSALRGCSRESMKEGSNPRAFLPEKSSENELFNLALNLALNLFPGSSVPFVVVNLLNMDAFE